MDANKSQNSAENKSLGEFDISSISSATGMDPKDEKIQKLELELQQIKEANSNQIGGSSMKQMGIQIVEIFCKMEKEMDALKAEVNKMKEEKDEEKAKLEGLKAEVNKIKEEKDEEKAKLEGLLDKMKTKFDGKIVKFEGNMRELQKKKADKKEVANLTGRIDEMGFIQMKNNKWNAADCGPKLAISEGGLVVKHSAGLYYGFNCIRVISPITPFNSNATKPSVAGYFEAQIVHTKEDYSVDIGFCVQQFPLEGKWFGYEANSIGIYSIARMYIDGQFEQFGNAGRYFNDGDVIGVGIIHSPANKSMKCFSTCNGQLLGTIELPSHFASFQLFPAATLFFAGDSIRANFGAEKWLFNPSQLLQ